MSVQPTSENRTALQSSGSAAWASVGPSRAITQASGRQTWIVRWVSVAIEVPPWHLVHGWRQGRANRTAGKVNPPGRAYAVARSMKRAGTRWRRPPDRAVARRSSGGRGKRRLVDLGDRQLVELLVGSLLLVQGRLEELFDVLLAQRVGERADRAVRGDLVMLDLLRADDQGGIEDLGGLDLLDHLLGLLDQALHRLAALAARADVELLEYLVQALDLTVGLVEMMLERLPQLGRLGRFGHLRQ